MKLTEAQAAAAFALWEERYRADSSAFMTADEVARSEVADLATQSAIYFLALVREVTGSAA